MTIMIVMVSAILFAFGTLLAAHFLLRSIQVKNRNKVRARRDLIEINSGMLVAHGMVRTNPGSRGLSRDKKLSNFYFDTIN